ncbi:MAG: tetratricopeptide repeat protein [Bacteroidia bacterium]|nr:tetratricopeptide repeat protein [Bacteroidia bacterium]
MVNTGRIDMLYGMLKKEPNDLFLNYALGMELLNNASDLSIAKQQFQKVLNLNPEYVPAYYQLGKLCELLVENTEAMNYYQKGLQLAKQQSNNKAINEFGEAIFLLED